VSCWHRAHLSATMGLSKFFGIATVPAWTRLVLS